MPDVFPSPCGGCTPATCPIGTSLLVLTERLTALSDLVAKTHLQLHEHLEFLNDVNARLVRLEAVGLMTRAEANRHDINAQEVRLTALEVAGGIRIKDWATISGIVLQIFTAVVAAFLCWRAGWH